MINSISSKYSKEYRLNRRLPAEYLVRMIKGEYPKLNLKNWYSSNDKVLDASCGDGRHSTFLADQGFNVYGYEIDKNIVSLTKSYTNNYPKIKEILIGDNKNIPFKSNFFNGIISWNHIYYLKEKDDFPIHIKEISRVAINKAWIIFSIPMSSCFIYKNSKSIQKGVVEIKEDYFGMRDGSLMQIFESKTEIQKYLSIYFEDIIIGTQKDDCFGLNYHWFLIACRNKSQN